MNIKYLPYQGEVNSQSESTPQIRVLEHDFFEHFRNQKLSVATQSMIHFLDLDDICFLKSEGNYCKLILEENKSIMASKTLKHFASKLVQKPFIRVHNSYLVNLTKVVGLKKGGDMCLILSNGIEIPVSRKYKEELCTKFLK